MDGPGTVKIDLGCVVPKTEDEDDGNAGPPKGEGVLNTFGVVAMEENAEPDAGTLGPNADILGC